MNNASCIYRFRQTKRMTNSTGNCEKPVKAGNGNRYCTTHQRQHDLQIGRAMSRVAAKKARWAKLGL